MTDARRRPLAFAVTGLVAMALSCVTFAWVLARGGSPHAATLARLATALPVLYAGYSRVVLAPTLIADRARLGALRAELRMIVHVAAAIGASAVLKLVLEPPLTRWLAAHAGGAALAAPLIGDLGYGPLAAYAILALRARGRAPDPRPGS